MPFNTRSGPSRLTIDTRSAAKDDQGSTFDVRNETTADVGAKVGPWGVNAQMKNTIGFVSTERSQTTEQMNTDLDLNSSVELILRTDYVPLERLAGGGDVNRIRVNSLNPDTENKIAADERKARRDSEEKADATRSSDLNKMLTPSPPSPPATPKVAPTAEKKPDEKKPEEKKTEPPKTDAAKTTDPKADAAKTDPKAGATKTPDPKEATTTKTPETARTIVKK